MSGIWKPESLRFESAFEDRNLEREGSAALHVTEARMPSAQEAREARRRKILARGSDRLAFITGELPAVPSPALPSSVAPTLSGSGVSSTAIPRSGDAALIRLSDTGPSGKPRGPLYSAFYLLFVSCPGIAGPRWFARDASCGYRTLD